VPDTSPIRKQNSALSPPPHGFENIRRYWDQNRQVCVAKVLPGEFYVSDRDEMIVTLLGSCVSACIRDVHCGVGGINHFMLPVGKGQSKKPFRLSDFDTSTRYGEWAMEYLVNEILKLGGRREDLEVKLFGGGRVVRSINFTDVGARNIEFVQAFVNNERLKVVAEDLGGNYARKVIYFPATGFAKIKKLTSGSHAEVVVHEAQYAGQIKKKTGGGKIEIF